MSNSRSPSRAQQEQISRRRDLSQSPSEASMDEDASPIRPQSRTARRRRNRKQQQSGGGIGLPAVDEVGDTTRQVTSTAKGVTNAVGGAVGGGKEGGGGAKDTLRLRLDLNLDVQLTLKAKVHGDLTLALLS